MEVEKLPEHMPYEFCWLCKELGSRPGGGITWVCGKCEVEWRAYANPPRPLDTVLWMTKQINTVDFRPRADWPTDSPFTDPRIPSAP